MPIGRPSKYSQTIADKICEQISTTCKGLVTICKSKGMPSTVTVYAWLNDPEHNDFLNNYRRARETQADILADEIITIADTCRIGKKIINKPTGIETTEGDMVERSRLMIDARKWKASKLAPKKYGDKLDVTTNGASIATIHMIHTPSGIPLANSESDVDITK